MRRLVSVACIWGVALLLGACAGIGSDDPTPTPTVTIAEPTATTAESTGTATETDAQTEPTASETDSTPANPTQRPTTAITSTAGASPTATNEPLPTDGAELQIEGFQITNVIPGDGTGRTFYAVADNRLWRTNDGGRSWDEAGDGDIGTVTVALNQQNVLYSGDRGGCGRGFSFHPFQRSSDAGRTWEVIDASLDYAPYLAYDIQGEAIIYGSNCGMSVSTDGGDTWTPVPDLNGEEVFAISTERTDPMAEVIVVAATEGGTGRLFLFDTNDPSTPLFVEALAQFWGSAAVDWADGRIVLATAHEVGVSDDTGKTWQWGRQGLEDATFSVDPFFEDIPDDELNPFRGFAVASIDPADRDHIWLGAMQGAYRSIDGGQSWQLVGDNVEITGIVISALSDRVFVSSESGTRLWPLDER